MELDDFGNMTKRIYDTINYSYDPIRSSIRDSVRRGSPPCSNKKLKVQSSLNKLIDQEEKLLDINIITNSIDTKIRNELDDLEPQISRSIVQAKSNKRV